MSKIESIRSAIKDGIVRIVLLGSFSDGKTTAIAGLLGRLEDTMKIDSDESSDELKVYRPLGLKKGFEIVDTPGLFGTKEKEVNGENIKFSDITKRYISEAHIIIYVCDAVNPLKDSHVGVIKWVLRDLGKLSKTIFNSDATSLRCCRCVILNPVIWLIFNLVNQFYTFVNSCIDSFIEFNFIKAYI